MKIEVFVFGSNLAGMHTGGAARVAYERFGSRDGAGASACRDSRMPSLPPCKGGVETIKPYVDDFIRLAPRMGSEPLSM